MLFRGLCIFGRDCMTRTCVVAKRISMENYYSLFITDLVSVVLWIKQVNNEEIGFWIDCKIMW